MGKPIVAMVLAGGRVDELSVLTAKRPKSAVPVWGMYRFIDFVLSNLVRSGIDTVGVLSQYRPYSLNAHLAGGAPWDLTGRTRALKVLSPFKGEEDTDWYRGTADAVYQNLNFLDQYAPELTLIASGDHLYSMDYREMIRRHRSTGAELTIALTRVPPETATHFGTATLDASGRVTRYEEKAARPRSDLASLTVYVFSTRTLIERLRQNAAEGRSFQIYSEIIPRMVEEGAGVFGYVFEGYWRYARTLDGYYEANMDIVGPRAPDLASWAVRTNLTAGATGDPAPALFAPTASALSSLVGPAATVAGTVERSVISAGVVIEAGAEVRDSVVMAGCTIGAGAVVDRAILDKNVRVGEGARVGTGRARPSRSHAGTLSCGVTVVGKATAVPAGARIGRNCIVAPDLPATALPSSLPSGSSVLP